MPRPPNALEGQPSPKPKRYSVLAQLAAVALAVFAMALAVRISGTAPLREATEVRSPSPDAHHYLRRTVLAFHGDTKALDADPSLGCPDQTPTPWAHGLDAFAATAARLMLPEPTSDAEVERFAAWLPPLLGALASALAAMLAMAWLGAAQIPPVPRQLPWRAGLLAGALTAMMPLRVANEAWSLLDHHLLAGLVPPLVLGLRWRAEVWRRGALRGRWLIAEVGAVLAAAAGYATWTEMWFQHALLLAIGALWTLVDAADSHDRTARLRRWALWSTLASLTAIPSVLSAPYWKADLVALHAASRATLWATAAVSAGAWAMVAGAQLLSRRPGFLGVPRLTGALATLAVLAGGAVLALAAALDASMRQALVLAGSFAGRSGVVASIDESIPLLARAWPEPLVALGAGLLLAPWLPRSLAGIADSPRRLLLTWYWLALPLALLQTRFALVFSTPFALVLAASLLDRERPRLRWGAALGSLAMVLPLLQPNYWTPLRQSREKLMQFAAREVALPADGLHRCTIAPWDLGHELVRVGGQRVVAHNFTELQDRERIAEVGRWLLQPPGEPTATTSLDPFAGLVWLTAFSPSDLAVYAQEAGLPAPTPAQLLKTRFAQLLLAQGSADSPYGLSFGQAQGHWRRIRTGGLRTAWPPDSRGGMDVAADQLFLWVQGAVLAGNAAPGTPIRASMEVQHPGSGAWTWTQRGAADAEGHFSLRVPYASGEMGHGLRGAKAWTVRIGEGESHEVSVREIDVLKGHAVVVGQPLQLPEGATELQAQ